MTAPDVPAPQVAPDTVITDATSASTSLTRLTAGLAAARTLSEVAELTVRELPTLVNVRRVSLLVVSRDRRVLQPVAGEQVDCPTDLDTSNDHPCAVAARTGRLAAAADGSTIAVPLTGRSSSVGVILATPATPTPPSGQEELLAAAAAHVALAVVPCSAV